MKIPKTPMEASIYPDPDKKNNFTETLRTKQEMDFARNLIILSRKKGNQWLDNLDSKLYFEECNHHNIKSEDSHIMCFERLVDIGYLEKISGNEYVYKITDKFIEHTPSITHPHPSHH